MAHVSVFFIVKNGILSILFVPLPCQFTLIRKCNPDYSNCKNEIYGYLQIK